MAPTIGQALARPANGFTLLRLILAVLVVVSHAFSVVTGRAEDEPLARLTGFTLGSHAVDGFFAISGFLVTMSFCRRGWRDYAIARALRIVPGFVVAVLVVTLVLGSAVTTLPVAAYLRDAAVWRFVVAALTGFKSSATLPGVFEGNPFRFVLGTIWTLKYEVLCYLGVLAAGLAGLLRSPRAAILVAAGLFVALIGIDAAWPTASKGTQTTLRLAFLFAAGAALHMARDRVPASPWIAGALALAAWLAAHTAAYHALLFAAEAYGIIVLACAKPLARPAFDLRHDVSYGVYLYGWPIQQAARHVWPDGGIVGLLVPSLLATFAVAALSWSLIERPALALKARTLGRRAIRTIEPAAP